MDGRQKQYRTPVQDKKKVAFIKLLTGAERVVVFENSLKFLGKKAHTIRIFVFVSIRFHFIGDRSRSFIHDQ